MCLAFDKARTLHELGKNLQVVPLHAYQTSKLIEFGAAGTRRLTIRNKTMESANWDNIASRIKENSDAEVIFGEIAVRGAQPPIGAITRLLLITWAKANGPHDRLLSLVLGSNDRSSKIILDLMENDLESALPVFKKMLSLSSAAEGIINGLKDAGGIPTFGKQMLAGRYQYQRSLVKLVPAQYRFTRLQSESIAPRVDIPSIEPEASLDKVGGLLRNVTSWASLDVHNAVRDLHARAAAEEQVQRRKKLWLALEKELFGAPKRLMRRKRNYGLGFSVTLMGGPDFFELSGLPDTEELNDVVWGRDWQSLIAECREAVEIELNTKEGMPGQSDVNYWIAINDPLRFARQLREQMISIACENVLSKK